MGTILKYKPKASSDANYRVFDDRYRLLSILGQGRESIVYRAVKLPEPHPASGSVQANTVYALKVFTRKTKDPELKVAQIMREASAMLSCRHENVVQLYDVVTLGDLCYLVMEYVNGGNLAAALSQKNAPVVPHLALLLTTQALNGLSAVHEAGIVHRDVKPANLLVTKDGSIKIADFSIARLPSGPGSVGEESLGIGTFDYLAPECLEGNTSSAASDIYAVAVTTYQLLTNHLPFEGDSLTEKVDKKMDNKYIPIKSYAPDVPQGLEALIRRGLMVDPAKRYQSAEEFKDEIQNFIKSVKDTNYRRAAVLIKAMQDNPVEEPKDNVFDISDAAAYKPAKARNYAAAKNRAKADPADGKSGFATNRALSQLSTVEDAKLNAEIASAARSAYRKNTLFRAMPLIMLLIIGAGVFFHQYPDKVPPELKAAAVEFNTRLAYYLEQSEFTERFADRIRPPQGESPAASDSPYSVQGFADGSHTLVLTGLTDKQVQFKIKRLHDSEQVLTILHLPNASARITPAESLADAGEFARIDLGYSLTFSVTEVDVVSGKPLSGRFLDSKSGKTGSWSVQASSIPS